MNIVNTNLWLDSTGRAEAVRICENDIETLDVGEMT